MANEQTPITLALLPLKKYAQFSGRSTKAEYWWFTFAFVVMGFVADGIDLVLGSEVGLLGLMFTLGFFVPTLSVTVRRLHDIGYSGLWLLVVIAPAAVFGFQTTYAALDQKFNEVEPTSSSLVSISAFVIACLILMICMALPGKKGGNDYGSDPYGDDGSNAFA